MRWLCGCASKYADGERWRPLLVHSLPRARQRLSADDEELCRDIWDARPRARPPQEALRRCAVRLRMTREERQIVALCAEVVEPTTLNFDGLCNVLCLTRGAKDERCMLLFSAIDRDGNGVLDKHEFTAAVMVLSPGLPRRKCVHTAKEVFRVIDADGNSVIDKQEFYVSMDYVAAKLLLCEALSSAMPTENVEFEPGDPNAIGGVLGMEAAVELRFDGPVVRVTEIVEGGPADKAGLQEGFCISGVAGKSIGKLMPWRPSRADSASGQITPKRPELDEKAKRWLLDAFEEEVLRAAEAPTTHARAKGRCLLVCSHLPLSNEDARHLVECCQRAKRAEELMHTSATGSRMNSFTRQPSGGTGGTGGTGGVSGVGGVGGSSRRLRQDPQRHDPGMVYVVPTDQTPYDTSDTP